MVGAEVRMRWLLGLILAAGVGGAAVAGELRLEGELVQGGMAFGQAPPGSSVRFAGRELRLTDDGRFVIGFGRDSEPEAVIEVTLPDGRSLRHPIEIEERAYHIQRIDGLAPRQVTPSEEDLARIQREAGLLNAARERDSAALGFTEEVAWPVTGPITGVFGSQRILNGEPRAPHRGVDVAAPPGTPVGAMASGLVTLAERDMFFTGGTVMVDHGHGVHSIYSHLDEVTVGVGSWLEQGETLGTVGATGRVTGAHLHWGVYWFDRAVDPELLVGPMPGE
jgi:murein DD-endopeptidase MepM/ murein hydrolase activator NlpD